MPGTPSPRAPRSEPADPGWRGHGLTVVRGVMDEVDTAQAWGRVQGTVRAGSRLIADARRTRAGRHSPGRAA